MCVFLLVAATKHTRTLHSCYGNNGKYRKEGGGKLGGKEWREIMEIDVVILCCVQAHSVASLVRQAVLRR